MWVSHWLNHSRVISSYAINSVTIIFKDVNKVLQIRFGLDSSGIFLIKLREKMGGQRQTRILLLILETKPVLMRYDEHSKNNWEARLTNSYHRRKLNRWAEIKSWTTLFAFYFVLMPLGNTRVFFPQLKVNTRKDWLFSIGKTTSLRNRKIWIQTNCTPLKNWPCVTSCSE